MSTTKELAVRMNRSAIKSLAANLDAMPADKQAWKPLDLGRTALNQVQECAVINPWFAGILANRAVPEMDGGAYGAAIAALDSADKAMAALIASADTLAAAIEAFPDDLLHETVTLPFGKGMVMTFEEIMLAPYWNMVYHQGQIAYVQTLYGDTDMHGFE